MVDWNIFKLIYVYRFIDSVIILTIDWLWVLVIDWYLKSGFFLSILPWSNEYLEEQKHGIKETDFFGSLSVNSNFYI